MVAVGRNIGTMLTGRSSGDNLQATLQALGMGQRAAAMQAALHDLSQGNLAGYQKNMFEAATGFDPGAMRGGNIARPFGCAHPGVARGPGRVKYSHTYHDSFGSAHTTERRDLKTGFRGLFKGHEAMSRFGAKCIERRLMHDPMYRASFEAKVGGKVVFDGRMDGKVTIRRFTPNIPGLKAGAFNALAANPLANMALGGLTLMQGAAANLMGGILGGNIGSALGYNRHDSSMRWGAGAPGSAVSRLGPGASFEDLVAAFMVDTIKDMQEEAKKKMDEIRNSINSNKRGGIMKGLKGFLGQAIGMAGTAVGFAYGGPVGASVGGAVGGAVGNAVTGNAGGKGADSHNLMFEELKNIMQKLSQMQQALSNVLNTMHQGAMNAVRNIRA
jgi:hypothetical protein